MKRHWNNKGRIILYSKFLALCSKLYAKRPLLFALCSLLLALCLILPDRAISGPYLNSAHGNTTTGVARTATRAASINYPIGHCGHCHEQHASIGGSEPAPSTPAGPDEYLLFSDYTTGSYSAFCLKCHVGAGSLQSGGGTPDDINTPFTKTYNHNKNTLAHSLNETLADISANKHAYCRDCHNPHYAGKTKHTAGTTGNAIGTTSPLYQVWGSITTFYATNWTAPTYTLGTATKEYEICFKCHSSANTNYSTWGGTGVLSWTDVGLEFSTGNASIHPVTTGLSGLANSPTPKALDSATRLVAPWNTAANLGTQTMYCSDCHNYTEASPAGPHGSAVKWMLSGTNQAWPYTTTAGNGTSTGTYWTLSNYSTGTAPNTLFCRNCHTIEPGTGKNEVHGNGQHDSYKCVDCHIRVPHGGKVSRLLNADSAGTALPARYYPDGAGGGGLGTDRLKRFTKRTPAASAYSTSDCGAGGCYAGHSATTGETW